MKTGALAGVAIGMMTLVGCKGAGPKLNPESGYAKLRPGIVKAVTEFPADPGTLVRCSPKLGRAVLLTLGQSSAALNIPLTKPQPTFGTAGLRTFADEHLAQLERKDFQDYSYGSFEGATRFAMFGMATATPPTMTGCEKVPNPNSNQMQELNCKLTPGVIDGSLIVFEAAGRPSCAVRVKVAGPVRVAGSFGADGDMSRYVNEVLRALLETDSPAWLSKFPPGRLYTVTIEGAVVREPAPPEQ